MLPINTVGEPGVQGAAVMGVHGIGVSTPRAAAVAEATAGFAMLKHMMNGGMFTNGLLSMIVADGVLASCLFVGRTFSVLGPVPKLHNIIAPVAT
jgi:hypothetical protein